MQNLSYLPFISMIHFDCRDISRVLKGLTLTATLTEDILNRENSLYKNSKSQSIPETNWKNFTTILKKSFFMLKVKVSGVYFLDIPTWKLFWVRLQHFIRNLPIIITKAVISPVFLIRKIWVRRSDIVRF